MTLHPQAIGPVPEETARVARAACPKGNPYLAMRDLLGPLYEDQHFAALFPLQGQPAFTPWRLALVTIMQFAEGLSDRQAAEAVRVRLDWKYALNLELSDPGFDFSILCEFRARLLTRGAEHLLFETMLEHFKARGLVKARGQQRTDSTHVLAAIRTLNRLECVGETMRHALESLAVVAPTWLLQHARSEWKERYEHRIQEYRLPASKPERVALAETIGADGFALLSAIDFGVAPAWLREVPAVQTLRRVGIQQFYASNGPVRWRTNEDLPPAAVLIQSPYAVQARFGLKRTTTWTGYKVHLTETCEPDQPNLITCVQTTDATVPATELLDPIHTHLAERDRLPAEHLVDAGYVDAGVLVTAASAHQVDVIGPVRADTNWQARQGLGFAAACFVIDWDAKCVYCPQGKRSASWKDHRDHLGHDVIDIAFGWADCKRCPVRSACTQKQHGSRTMKLLPRAQCLALYAARQRQQTSEFREHYVKRAGIEGTLSQGVRRSKMRRSRYIGLARTHLQHLLTATALNLIRAVAWLVKTPRTTTRPSRFAALLAAG
jgi:transposase